MSSIPPFSSIQQCLTRYGITIYTTLGNIGLILNIFIFIQPAHRRNPSSLYILAMSICALVGLNMSVIPVIDGLDHSDPLKSSLIFCQLQLYLRHAFNQMMRTFFVLACADRYAISSNHARIRSFNRYQVAIRLIPSIILLWLLLPIFSILVISFVYGVCDKRTGWNGIFACVYILFVVGIIPLLCMITFSILLLINLKMIRKRVQPIMNTSLPVNQILRKLDRDMMRMLLIEVICYITTTTPVIVMLIYNAATGTQMKNDERRQIESFASYLTTTFLLYINNSLSFWIYITVSKSFRLELRKLMIKCYVFITGKQVRMNEIY